MVGNLVDNACKWAQMRVSVEVVPDAGVPADGADRRRRRRSGIVPRPTRPGRPARAAARRDQAGFGARPVDRARAVDALWRQPLAFDRADRRTARRARPAGRLSPIKNDLFLKQRSRRDFPVVRVCPISTPLRAALRRQVARAGITGRPQLSIYSHRYRTVTDARPAIASLSLQGTRRPWCNLRSETGSSRRMMLWLILALMTIAALGAVVWPLVRARGMAAAGSDLVVYRDQLEEIERDRTERRIGADEAEAARVEVSRRLLAAASAEMRKAGGRRSRARRRFAVVAAAGDHDPAARRSRCTALLGSPELPGQPLAARTPNSPRMRSTASPIGQLLARVEAHLAGESERRARLGSGGAGLHEARALRRRGEGAAAGDHAARRDRRPRRRSRRGDHRRRERRDQRRGEGRVRPRRQARRRKLQGPVLSRPRRRAGRQRRPRRRASGGR